jgi:hexosaminidase
VDAYLAQPSPDKLAQLRAELTAWKNNDAQLQPQIAQSFLLKEVAPLSANLASVADIGLQALNYIDQKQVPHDAWRTQSLQRITDASKPQADLLIMIAPAVQKLVQVAPSAKM